MLAHKNSDALFLISHSSKEIDLTDDIEKEEFSKLASIRLQIQPAIKASSLLGLNPKVFNLRSEVPECISSLGSPKICIIGKLKTNKENQPSVTVANLAAISRLKQKNIPIIVIYSDNNASPEKDWSHKLYRDLLNLADLVVCPNNAILTEAKSWMQTKSLYKVIEDPCQVPLTDFTQLEANNKCKMIWFGHNTNSFYLLRELPKMLTRCDKNNYIELTILGDVFCLRSSKNFINSQQIPSNWKFRLIPWSIQAFKQETKLSNIALIPSDPHSNIKKFASHNRAVDALQGGCMVIASPIPSYVELRKSILIGDDFPVLINEGIRQYSRLTKKWELNRKEILSRFEPQENLSKWIRCLKLLCT